MQLKYLTLETPDGLLVPVIFSELLLHKTVAAGLRSAGAPRSAGFTKIIAEESQDAPSSLPSPRFLCFGESDSLRLKSLPEDSDLLNQHYR